MTSGGSSPAAGVANPAFERDPITSLPTEVGVQIIACLDVRSMYNAARVGKDWLRLVHGYYLQTLPEAH
jgi:hypothetical protein